MVAVLQYEDLLDQELVWLLTVTFGGQVIRLASEHTGLTDEDGDAVFFEGGLDDIEFEDAVRGLSDDPELLCIPVSVFFPEWINVPQMVSRGHQLSAATAEVALIPRGKSRLEDRRVVVIGNVTQPEYGSVDEPVSFSVEEQPYSDRAQIPEAGAVLTEDRFSNQGLSGYTGVDEDFVVLYGPIVFGNPGLFTGTDGTTKYTSGSGSFGYPILRDSSGDVTRILVASHRVVSARWRPSTNSYTFNQVRVWDSSGGVDDWEVFNDEDDLGRWYAFASPTGSTSVDQQDTDFRGGWISGPPALLGDEGDQVTGVGAPTGAGDLLIWFLRRTSLRLDVGRWEAARGTLNRFKFSGYLDEAVSPWQYIQDNFLPLLPLSIRSGPSGLYPVIWRWDATESDAVAALVAGPEGGLSKTSSVAYTRSPSEVVNEIRLEYARQASTGNAKRYTVLVLTGDPDPDDPSQWTNQAARVSLARYGVGSKTIETDVVYDDKTAHLICQWQLAVYGNIPREITYEASREWGWLEPGQVVTLTDSELYMSNQVALIESVSWSGAAVEIKVVVL